MIGPGTMQVLLHVPEWVRAGLARGDYKAFGGTIRDLGGRTVALLTEGQSLSKLVQDAASLDPDALMNAIGHVQTAMQLADGLGALNLVVSGAGFAMMRQRLDQIVGQLRELTAGLQDLKEEAGWISGLQLAGMRSEIDAALDMAIRAHRQGHLQSFRDAKGRTFEVRRRLHHTMAMMLDTRRALPRHQVFGELALASAILAVAEVRCDEAVEGAQVALEALGSARRDLQDSMSRFDAQRRDVASDPQVMVALGSAGRREIIALQRDMLAVDRQLEGALGRLAVQANAGLSREEWHALTVPGGSGLLTCLAVPEGVDADLRDWVRPPDGPAARA